MTKHQPWTWRGYAPQTPPERFGPLAEIAQLWRSRWHDERTFPHWSDFDLMDFQGWWGQIALHEIQREPFDLCSVLWGTRLTNWWGADYTQRLMSTIEPWQRVWQEHEFPYFQALIQRRLIGFVTGSLSAYDRSFTYVRGIDLPLQKDGTISHVMTVFQAYDPDDLFIPDAPAIYEDRASRVTVNA